MKGIITDIKGGEAVLLNEQGQFIKITNKKYGIGQKITYNKPVTYKYFYYMAASLIFFMMTGYTGYSFYYTPTSYISIDINPSLQLEANRLNKVIKTTSFNDDAENVLSTVNIKHHDLEDSIETLVNASKDMGYLNDQNNYIAIDVLSPNDNLTSEVTDDMEKYIQSGAIVSVEKSNKSELKLSKESGISLGKAKAVIKYTDVFGGDVKNNISKLSDVSVGKIIKSVNAKKDVEIIPEKHQEDGDIKKIESKEQPNIQKQNKEEKDNSKNTPNIKSENNNDKGAIKEQKSEVEKVYKKQNTSSSIETLKKENVTNDSENKQDKKTKDINDKIKNEQKDKEKSNNSKKDN